MKITTILPVSRIKYLDRVLDSLLKQTVKIENLIVVFDGPDNEFVTVRNKIAELEIENTLCVKTPYDTPCVTIAERRWRIVSIHKQIQEILGDCEWVFSIEDDGILPKEALQRLIFVLNDDSNAGMITGVELGRWGLPYVGAWRVDDVFEPKRITSMKSQAGQDVIEEIDGCGLYCALIRARAYREHKFDTSNGLGPDVNLGLFLRQRGYKNYINWSIPVTHLGTLFNHEAEFPATGNSRVITLTPTKTGNWRQEKA